MGILDAVISGGSGLLGSVVGAISSGKQNKKMREYNDQQYSKQRADALADYHMQNAYNSPAAQMQRLKEAGLNPNLVYGHGADAQGGIVRSTEAKNWNPQQIVKGDEIGSAVNQGLSAYYSTQLSSLQADNLAKQGVIMDQEAKLKATANTAAQLGILSKTFDYNMKSNLAPWTEEAAKQKVNALINGINTSQRSVAVSEGQLGLNRENLALNQRRFGLDQQKLAIDQERLKIQYKDYQIRSMLAQQSFDKMAQEMLSIERARGLTDEQIKIAQQNIKNLKQDGTAKEWENMLRARGNAPNDPWAIRMGNEMLEKMRILMFQK